MMRIILHGQAAFGAAVLEALLEQGHSIVAVYTPPSGATGRANPVQKSASANGIRVVQTSSYKNNEVFEEYSKLSADLAVLAFVTEVIPSRYFSVPSKGAICYHPSLLPRHRGASAINWALIMGDDKTGVSIFCPDKGIDTGPVVVQKVVDIDPNDSVGSLYFNHLFPMGVDAIVEGVNLLETGEAKPVVQDESCASYEPPCDDQVAQINWSMPGAEIHNLVRGCDPHPGAFTLVANRKVRLYGSEFVADRSATKEAKIIAVEDPYICVSTYGGVLRIRKMADQDSGKIDASEYVADAGLHEGDFLAMEA